MADRSSGGSCGTAKVGHEPRHRAPSQHVCARVQCPYLGVQVPCTAMHAQRAGSDDTIGDPLALPQSAVAADRSQVKRAGPH